MKLVTAVVHPRTLDDIRSALGAIGAGAMTVTEAHDVVAASGGAGALHAGDDTVDFVPRLRLELLADDDDADRVAGAIVRWAGGEGNGVLWVSTVESPVRHREDELAAAAVPLAS